MPEEGNANISRQVSTRSRTLTKKLSGTIRRWV